MARHEPADAELRETIVKEVGDYLRDTGSSDSELARRASVPQSFVWHLKRGHFKKVTPRLRRVRQYIHMDQRMADPVVDGVTDAIRDFFAAGGDLAVLRSGIEMLTRAYAKEQAYSTAPKTLLEPRRRRQR